jgi:uncharacterized protein
MPSESLFDAVRAGDAAHLKALLTGGADPNPFDAEGRTPLMLAAEQGAEALVRTLLDHGADATLPDRMGEGALAKAAAHGHERVARMIFPFAPREEQELALTLLRVGTDLSPLPRESTSEPGGLRHRLATAGAYVTGKLGGSTERLERLQRAEKHTKKS